MAPRTMIAALRRRALRAAGVFAVMGALLNHATGSPFAFMAPTGSPAAPAAPAAPDIAAEVQTTAPAAPAAPDIATEVQTTAPDTVVADEAGVFSALFSEPTYLKLLLTGTDFRRGFVALKQAAETAQVSFLKSSPGDWYAQGGNPKKVLVIAGGKENILAAFKEFVEKLDGKIEGNWTRGRMSFLLPWKQGTACFYDIRAAAASTDGGAVKMLKAAAGEGVVKVYGTKATVVNVAAAVLDAVEQDSQELLHHRNPMQHRVPYSTIPTTIKMDLTPNQQGAVIGKGGYFIQGIREQFYVEASIRDAVLTLSGGVGDVQAAHAVIAQKLAAASEGRRSSGPRTQSSEAYDADE